MSRIGRCPCCGFVPVVIRYPAHCADNVLYSVVCQHCFYCGDPAITRSQAIYYWEVDRLA